MHSENIYNQYAKYKEYSQLMYEYMKVFYLSPMSKYT